MTEKIKRQNPDNRGRKKAIEVKNLASYYGRKQVLKNVNLEVYEGERLVIMGGSGSGKTTILRHLLGLKRTLHGTVKLLGQNMEELNTVERYGVLKQIGVAYQSGAMLSSLTVGDNLTLPLREHTKLAESTMEIMARMKLEVCNMAGTEDLLPSELSGGMLKRAALARAMIMDPKILFCDEPSAGLDPMTQSTIDDLLIRLNEVLGMTIVVVTHELESAFRIAQRIAMLHQGEMIMCAPVDEVRNSKDPRIFNFLNRNAEDTETGGEGYLERLTEDLEA